MRDRFAEAAGGRVQLAPGHHGVGAGGLVGVARLLDDGGLRWLTPGVRGIGAASLLSDLGHPCQANAYLTAYSTLEEDVFIAPCVVTTNDNYMGRTEKRLDLLRGPTIRRGARVGGGRLRTLRRPGDVLHRPPRRHPRQTRGRRHRRRLPHLGRKTPD